MNILVTRSSMPPLEDYVEEIKSIWESHWMTNMGEKHHKLEDLLKQYLGVADISLMTNGHMALELTIQALQLKGEIITTPFTFASTTHAIMRNGITPVFCDINESDYTIDVNKIEELITDKTTAILPVHVYGNICDVEAIEKIAKKNKLKVIYDAAHTFGVKYKQRGIASYGDASIFSFHATKVFNTIEGGAVCFNDERLGLDLYRLKNFGIRDPEIVDFVGSNAKMNEFQAAMGICNLKYIEQEIKKRQMIHNKYIECLGGVPGIQLLNIKKGVTSNYAYFPICINEQIFGKNRDEIFSLLEENGIGARKYFYPLASAFECYKDRFDVNKTPNALQISKSVLTLPMYADLSIQEVDFICNIILNGK